MKENEALLKGKKITKHLYQRIEEGTIELTYQEIDIIVAVGDDGWDAYVDSGLLKRLPLEIQTEIKLIS